MVILKNPLSPFIDFTQKLGVEPSDSKDEILKKQTLIMISLLICLAGLIWGFLYVSMGFKFSAVFPFGYSLIVGFSIVLFHYTKRYSHFLFTQLLATLLIPCFVQWSLGGFSSSGAVMIWSFLAPMGALMFQRIRDAIAWLTAYVVLLIILIFFDQAFVEIGPRVSIESRLIFYSMNISAVSVITFFTIHYFISEQIKEKRKNIELLDITRKNKLEIESQYELLTKQRDALEEEQNKTQHVLRKIETLFGQQVSKEVVKELVNTEGEIDSKLCNVTVMFLDIRDFTSFADSRLPEDVASFQNIVFGELINIVQKYKGIINQILGDGIMATFGAPVQIPSHTTDAVAAGYAMIGKIKELSDNGKIPAIRIGIGLHTGKVLAGNIGNQFRKQYSLTGSTVIVAARIEQLNKIYNSQFLISEAVYHEVKNDGHPVTFLGEIELKGFEKPENIYLLVS